ncbi:MAG: bifunctional helix-turn-helix transcriptional regulator/GNAT family N-acetyltransferase [Candidatus Aminicenantaceae bacterium]
MDFIKELGYLAVASRMKRLTDRFMRGGSQAYKSLGIDFEPRWFTVFYLIYTQDSPLSISEIASSLKISHPAVIQTTQMLIKKGLIKSFQDSQDRRIRRLAITGKGKELVNFLIPIWNDFETATSELFEKADVDMLDIIKRIEARLDEEDVGNRIINRIKQRQYNSVEILDYMPEYKEYFQKLNYEWLEKYFQVEDLDKKILLNPEEQIIKEGGFVLFARMEEKVVGTTAILKRDEKTYEIAKMAVTEKAQGMQVGRKLTKEAVARAKEKGAKKLILKTDNRLRAAVNLYRTFGFKVTQTESTASGKYERERFGIQMKLDL